MIEAAIFDVDGVLTDGFVLIDSRGEEIKRLFFDDIDAIFSLKRAGIKLGFITGEKNSFSQYVQKRFSPDFFVDGCKNKLGAFQKLEIDHKLKKESTCFTGDSLKDGELLAYVAHSFVPIDVNKKVKSFAKVILSSPRGRGAVAEVVDYIFDFNENCKKRG